MKAHSLKDTAALQTYFNQQLLPILKKHGKHMVGWDEIFAPGLSKDVVIQSWQGFASLAASAKQGYQGILSAGYYLDFTDEHYLVDPVPADSDLTPRRGHAFSVVRPACGASTTRRSILTRGYGRAQPPLPSGCGLRRT